MTGTIYLLKWPDNNHYIGQTSRSPQTRLSEHIYLQGRGNQKLLYQFKNHGDPQLQILEENIPLNELNNREDCWINRLQPNLNVLRGHSPGRGVNHSRSRYTIQQVLEVVNLWRTTDMTAVQISEQTGVGQSSVWDIVKKRTHQEVTKDLDLNRTTPSNNWVIWDPQGVQYQAKTLGELHLKTGVPAGTLHSIISSRTQQGHNGWTAKAPRFIHLTDPDGVQHCGTVWTSKKLLESKGLSKYVIESLTKKLVSSKGWKTMVCTQKCIDFF